MADRVEALILRVNADIRAAQQAKSEIRSVRREIATLGLSDASIARLNNKFYESTKNLKLMRRATEEVDQSIQKLGNRKLSTAQLTGGLSMSLGGRGLGGLVGRVGGAGAMQGVGVTTDILDTTRAISSLKTQFPELTARLVESAGGAGRAAASIGLMSVAMIGIGVALAAFQKAAKDSKQMTDAWLDVQKRYAEIIGTSTTKEVEDAIKKNEERNKVLEIERARLQQLVDMQEDTKGLAGAILDFNDAVGANLGGIEDVNNRLRDVNKELDANVGLNGDLAIALADGATAAADMIAAENELTDMRLKRIGQITDAEIKAADQIKTATSEQIKARLEAIPAELEANQKAAEEISGLMETMVPSSDEFKAAETSFNGYMDKVDALKIEQDALTNSILPLILKREAEKKAIDDLNNALSKSADYAKKRADIEKDFADQTAETAAKRTTDLLREEQDYQRKRLHDIAGFNVDLAGFDRDFYETRGEIIAELAAVAEDTAKEKAKDLAEFNKEDIRNAEDHGRKLLEIQRDSDRAISDAAGSLDTRAVIAAQQKAKDDIRDENEQYDTERKRRLEDFEDRLKELDDQRKEKQQAYAKQLRDLESQHNRERIDRINAFYAKLREEDQQRTIALNRQKEDWRTEDSLRASHFNTQLAALREQYSRELGETDVFFGNLQSLVIEGYQGILTAVGLMNAGTGGSTQSVPDIPPLHFAGGGRTPFGRDFMVGERGPEVMRLYQPGYVFPHGQGGGGGISISVPINIEGGAAQSLLSRTQGQRDFKRAVARAVVEVVEEFSRP